MVNRMLLQIRLTKNQLERIRASAQAKGFKTVSAYVRSVMLEHDLVFEKKFNELYNHILQENETVRDTKSRPLTAYI